MGELYQIARALQDIAYTLKEILRIMKEERDDE